jgi:ribosome maturation protein Sdo1
MKPGGLHFEHEFETSNDVEVIFHILEKGEIQENTVRNNPFLHYS